MPRLFFAVTPPAPAVADLDRVVESLRGAPGEPRWTPPQRWHVTLIFLGAVPMDRVPGLVAAAGPVAAGTPAMTLRLAGCGRFGSQRRPQVCWAGLAGDVAALGDLAGRLADATGQDPADRPFRPHLTLGRWRAGQPADDGLPARLAGYAGPGWPVTEVDLLASHLGPAPRYERVASWLVTTRSA